MNIPRKIENEMKIADGYIHSSIDDTNNLFCDLTKNNYNTIFEQPLLKYVKELHDKYGVVVSFYTYYSWDVETIIGLENCDNGICGLLIAEWKEEYRQSYSLSHEESVTKKIIFLIKTNYGIHRLILGWRLLTAMSFMKC